MSGRRRPVVVHVATIDMTLALLLGPQLEAFVAAGYDVVATSAPGPYRERVEATGARFVPLRHATRAMRPVQDLLALVELVRLFRRLRPDIVHTHNPKPGWYGRLAARLARVPHVVNTVHGLYALPEDRWPKRAVVYGLERAAAACSDAELVQNPEDIPTLGRLRVPAERLHLLGNGIDLARFDRDDLDPAVVAATRAGLLGDDPPVDALLVGVIGRLVWEKGLREVFAAAERLRISDPRVRVVLVGPTDPDKSDGLTDADLPRLAAAHGVRFAGERSDMPAVYAALDVFVLATYREGFPRAAMEATALGVPVVATNIRGCRQVVDDGVTGLLVPVRDAPALADAIGALSGDATRREAMGRDGVLRARREFDQQRQIDLTLDVYADLLGHRPTPTS